MGEANESVQKQKVELQYRNLNLTFVGRVNFQMNGTMIKLKHKEFSLGAAYTSLV